jgi:hypothetical protein
MKQDRIDEGRFSNQGQGLGTVTREMVRRRAGEIAVINGRDEQHLLDSDFAQAHRELTGEERLIPSPTAAEQEPESARWDPNPGSTGKTAETIAASDEQTFAEKLVEEGVEDAEHDQAIQATRESLRRDRQGNP